jgi:DNA-binding transcriptional ArsR family regulator
MSEQRPRVLWDWGTAYDLFASLHVLHHADQFGLRGSWAAGVRSRLTAPQRMVLEKAQQTLFGTPLAWVSGLPSPKAASNAISSLAQIKPAERLPRLTFHGRFEAELQSMLMEISARGAWEEKDFRLLQAHRRPQAGRSTREELTTILDGWAHADEFGESYLAALQAYVAAFFAEEEQRIQPYLQQSIGQAQEMASRLDFTELFLQLSQGVKIAVLQEADEVTFVPSYWITPLVVYNCIVGQRWVVLFGARPADVPLIPGDVVPEGLLRALKALSDPTRLLILRYLSEQPQAPSQLARRLRLRPPTVIHHLNALRLAGLVYVTLEEHEERRYAIRTSAIQDTNKILQEFTSMGTGG